MLLVNEAFSNSQRELLEITNEHLNIKISLFYNSGRPKCIFLDIANTTFTTPK